MPDHVPRGRRVLILHAYSRRNRGDGLLVDETIRIAKAALGPSIDCSVVCADTGSFRDLQQTIALPGVDTRDRLREAMVVAVGLGMSGLGVGVGGPLARRLGGRDFDLILGVGGGYLRAPGGISSLKTAVAHLQQLEWAAARGVPAVYLPQSVGPLRGAIGARIAGRLARLEAVCLRDDRSMQELAALPNTIRLPDLAVLRLARELDRLSPVRVPGAAYLIARDLPLPRADRAAYIGRLQELRRLVPDIQPLAQSEGRGNDDPAFYRELGWHGPVPTTGAIGDLVPGVVVSVRLHGSLGAMLAGFPSVHLSYERKGYGAFSDLGLQSHVHSSRSFDPARVAAQVAALRADATAYWARIRAAQAALLAAEAKLVRIVRDTCGVRDACHAA